MPEITDFSQKTDEQLVYLTLENQSVFLHIMKRYEQKLLRYIKRITNVSDEEAEDILQEVYIKVYQNLNSFDQSLKFSSWIYRITHNQVISNYRARQARPQNVLWDVNEDFLENIASTFDIKKDLEREFLKNNLQKVLAKMDKKYSEVLILKFLEEKDYNEISDILKKPLGTIASLISRAKKQFIKQMNKENIKL